jgi:hypothetical protein
MKQLFCVATNGMRDTTGMVPHIVNKVELRDYVSVIGNHFKTRISNEERARDNFYRLVDGDGYKYYAGEQDFEFIYYEVIYWAKECIARKHVSVYDRVLSLRTILDPLIFINRSRSTVLFTT